MRSNTTADLVSNILIFHVRFTNEEDNKLVVRSVPVIEHMTLAFSSFITRPSSLEHIEQKFRCNNRSYL